MGMPLQELRGSPADNKLGFHVGTSKGTDAPPGPWLALLLLLLLLLLPLAGLAGLAGKLAGWLGCIGLPG